MNCAFDVKTKKRVKMKAFKKIFINSEFGVKVKKGTALKKGISVNAHESTSSQ